MVVLLSFFPSKPLKVASLFECLICTTISSLQSHIVQIVNYINSVQLLSLSSPETTNYIPQISSLPKLKYLSKYVTYYHSATRYLGREGIFKLFLITRAVKCECGVGLQPNITIMRHLLRLLLLFLIYLSSHLANILMSPHCSFYTSSIGQSHSSFKSILYHDVEHGHPDTPVSPCALVFIIQEGGSE